MKTSSWFDAVALLLISLMSVASGVATDAGRIEAGQVLQAGSGQPAP